jgi:Ca2+/Na+ antiporter
MNLMLSKIGCALGISETVMGLTVGAIGTSFPNLYASILTARAGQAGMSLCQAFGSNTFNLCAATRPDLTQSTHTPTPSVHSSH